MSKHYTTRERHFTPQMCVFCFYRAALDRAAVLLKMSMGGLRIDNQWGSGGGQQPVIQLIKEVRQTCITPAAL